MYLQDRNCRYRQALILPFPLFFRNAGIATQRPYSTNKMIEDSIPKEFDVGAKVKVEKDLDIDGDGNPKKPKPRGGGAAGGFTVIQNIYANTTDYAKQQKEAARQFKMIARTV